MSQKERQRYHLLKMVIGGKITLKETDNLMGVSYRQAKRLKKKLISEGAKGLIHGNRGRPSPKALSHEFWPNGAQGRRQLLRSNLLKIRHCICESKH